MTPTTTSWSRIVLVYAAGILSAMQAGLIAPMVPRLEQDLGVSLAFMGWVLSVVTGIAALFGTLAGTWSERLGVARSIKIGLIVMTLMAALGAVATSGTALLVERVILGFGYLAAVVAGPTAITRLARPKDLGFALALWGAFVPVGIALAEALVGVSLAPLGWRGLFWGDAVLLALVAILALALLRDGPRAASHAEVPSFRQVLGMRGPLLLMLSFGAFTFTFMILAGMLPTFLTEGRGVSGSEAARIVAIATLFGIPGTLVAGLLVKRGQTPLGLSLIGLAIPAIAVLVLFLPGMPLSVMAGASVIAFLLGGMIPAATYAVLPLVAPDPRHFAPVNGLLTQIGSAGTLLGPPVFGAWCDATSWNFGAAPEIAAAAGGIACLLAVRRYIPART